MNKDQVAFVIPAFNAAATLDEAVASVVDQTDSRWELIIVDDGSSDGTAGIAEKWAKKDGRISLIRQENSGASAARNAGLRAARSEWIVFLDSDDWLAPDYLKLMRRPLRQAGVDCVICAAVDIDADGDPGKRWFPPPREQFFPRTACDCPIATHGVMVRRSLVEEVGGWDTGLATCEDWDLWQRLARSKAKMVYVKRDLAFIRLRPGSLSRTAASSLAADGLVVIERGHGPDSRVPDPDPQWADGLSRQDLDETLAYHLTWAAGLDLAAGGDGFAFVDMIPPDGWSEVDPYSMVESLEDAISHMDVVDPDDRLALLPRLREFIDRVAGYGGAPEFSRRARRHLEVNIFRGVVLAEPVTLDMTHAVGIDLERPIPDVDVPQNAEQLVAVVSRHGQHLFLVTLPVSGPRIGGRHVADAIAEQQGRRLAKAHFLNGGWRRPRVWSGAARLLLRPESRTFLKSLAQSRFGSQFERIRGFAQYAGQEFAGSWGLLRPENGHVQAVPRSGPRPVPPSGPPEDTADMEAGAVRTAPRRTPLPELDDGDSYGDDYWESIFAANNPWDYTNEYEQTKYRQTLDLLPRRRIGRALELACAEGHFTRLLAPHVETLVATDISQTALDRAAEACGEHDNITFQKLDLRTDPVPGKFDLIVCSEVLYYTDGHRTLRDIGRRLREHLEPGGLLLTAHGLVARNDPDRTGFDWGHPIDARSIDVAFSGTPGLRAVHEVHTPLYQIRLFEAVAPETPAAEAKPPVVEHKETGDLCFYVSSQVEWNGCAAFKRSELTDRLPILMYHRVAPEGVSALDRYRVTPEAFEAQMGWLAANGYYATDLETWRSAISQFRGLPGRAVILTFDDGYQDFYDHAWPILEKYGFTATVFVVPSFVGSNAEWDSAKGEPPPLMGWRRIRELSDQGITIGSHTMDHRLLTALPPAEIARQGAESRDIIARHIGKPVTSIAYPYGDEDDCVARIMADCGYTVGVTTSAESSRISDPPLQMSRIEVCGGDDLQTFAAKLPQVSKSGALRRSRFAVKSRLSRVKRQFL